MAWVARRRLIGPLQEAGRRLGSIPRRRWLAMVIVTGLALRIGWVLLFPAPVTSDGLSYYDLAARMARGFSYQTPQGEWAAWPPGYPFLLLVHFRALGIGLLAVTVANLLLFTATLPVVHSLAARLGDGPARLATLLLAFWPNLIASAGVASKELVMALLLPLILLLYLRAGENHRRGAILRFAAGLVLGYAILTQPAVMLIVGVFLAYEVLLRTPVPRMAARLALLALGIAVAVLPWTWRNYRALGAPVLVSTNGGSVFYRANNPLATGGWIQEGERSLSSYDELTRDRLGYRWGRQWIRENPGDFLLLAVEKQVLFLGDDATGLYEIKRGGGIGGALYALAKLANNAWWWGIWVLILVVFLAPGTLRRHRRAEVLLFLLTVLYFWAIDSVFESGARHHLPLVGVLAILAAAGAAARAMDPASEPPT
jgi:hypothetical protein